MPSGCANTDSTALTSTSTTSQSLANDVCSYIRVLVAISMVQIMIIAVTAQMETADPVITTAPILVAQALRARRFI